MSHLWFLFILLPVLGGAQRFNCKTRILGAYYPDTKSGCKAFHVCVRVAGGGVRDFRFYCPPGTLFHQEAQTCTDWGDDDPLACPTDIYDGQFDLYRIGSGYDTKKSSSPSNREEETDYALQQADTGDRRLSQNNIAPNAPSSDLRAAHSSDFFTGRRDRGRDEPNNSPQGPTAPQASAPFAFQSSPKPPSSIPQVPPAPSRQSFRRATTARTTTTQFTIPSSHSPQTSTLLQYETSKRKLTRKRPISVQNKIVPTTFSPYVPPEQTYSERPQNKLNRRVSFQGRTTTLNLPPQFKEYKDEYVEVSRVTPKINKFYTNDLTPSPFLQQQTSQNYNKKESLVEIYNYETTPGFNGQKENHLLNLKNSFDVVDVSKAPSFESSKTGNGYFLQKVPTTATIQYNNIRDSNTTPSSFRNDNNVAFKTDKQSFAPISKNNNLRSAATNPLTTTTTQRPDHLTNLNTVAYNTNIAFNVPSNNFAETDEDDGQYRPPQGEDDGQYRPELYEAELLSGAHSINIAASGNRLSENKKSLLKSHKAASQNTAPQPFNQVPPLNLPQHTTREPETYATQPTQTINTQRAFDYFKTYTTTSRPNDLTERNLGNNLPQNPTTFAPKISEKRPTRPHNRPSTTAPATVPFQSTTRSKPLAKPSNNKQDNSYDYAYYDSDPGFSEYDHNLEFGKTQSKS